MRRMVPRRSRFDQPFGHYSRKCLNTHTYMNDNDNSNIYWHSFRYPRISSRLAQHDLVFLHGVLNDRFDSSDIKGMIGLAVPARVTRTRPILHVPTARVETVKMACSAGYHVVPIGLMKRHPALTSSAIDIHLKSVCQCSSNKLCR